MRKLLNQPWFAAVLALAAIALIGGKFLGAGAPGRSGVATAAEPEFIPAEAEGGSRLSMTAALKAVQVHGAVRDPFALPVAAEAEEPAAGPTVPPPTERLHLSATWIQGATVLVLLNGQVCRPGETLGRFAVGEATHEGVWIVHAGERSFLPVGRDLVVTISGTATAPISP
ncbi:MAG: hypothetical protein QM691_03360 [Opitutaceae bacterium]